MPIVRINFKTSPFVREGYFLCVVCEECFPRRSNAQKYCDGCRRLATSKKVSEYYRKHRARILRQKREYCATRREEINEKQRQYHVETKAERPTRAMLREMK